MLCNNCTHILPQNFKHQIFSQSGWIMSSSLRAMPPMLGGFVVLGSRSLEDQKFKVLHYHHTTLLQKTLGSWLSSTTRKLLACFILWFWYCLISTSDQYVLAAMLLGHPPPRLRSCWHVSYRSLDVPHNFCIWSLCTRDFHHVHHHNLLVW